MGTGANLMVAIDLGHIFQRDLSGYPKVSIRGAVHLGGESICRGSL